MTTRRKENARRQGPAGPAQGPVLAAAGFGAGIAAGHALLGGVVAAVAVLAAFAALIAVRSGRGSRTASLALPVASFCAFGAVRALEVQDTREVARGATIVRAEGVVSRALLPSCGATGTARAQSWFSLEPAAVDAGDGPIRISGAVIVRVDRPRHTLPRGARVRVIGRPVPPRPPRNPGDAGSARLRSAAGIAAVIDVGSERNIARLRGPARLSPLALLDRARARLLRVMHVHLGERTAHLCAALTIGVRAGLDDAVLDAARQSGLVHLLAISGLHLAVILAVVRAGLALLFPPRTADGAALFAAVAFAAIAGAGTPVVRAAIGAATILVGRLLSRRTSAVTSLSVAFVVVLAWDPADLLRPGFQLSFAAVWGLVTLPHTPPSRGFVPRVRRAVRASTRAFLFTAPLIAHHFGVVSPLAPILTVAVTPVFLAALLTSCAFAVCGLSVPAACGALAPLAEAFLGAFAGAVEQASSLPLSCLYPPRPGLVAVIALLLAAAWPRPRVRALWFAIGLFATAAPVLAPREREMWVLDVGHGQAVLLSSESGADALVDAGSRGRSDIGTAVLLPALDALGAGVVDCAFVSHGDSDHVSGIVELVAAGRVREVVTGPLEEDTLTVRVLLEQCRRRGVPVRVARLGDVVRLAHDLEVRVIGPVDPLALESDNDKSLVLVARLGPARILLPGDVESAGIDSYLASGLASRADVLLLPHHGNRDPRAFPLIHRTRPKLAIASRGAPFPDRDLERACARIGARLLSTHDRGAIRVRFRTRETASGPSCIPRATGIRDEPP